MTYQTMTIESFAEKITNLDDKFKVVASRRLQERISTKTTLDNKPLTPQIERELIALTRWLNVNMVVGELLCPASSVRNFLPKEI